MNGYASPSQVVVDGSNNNIGGAVKIISGSGSGGNGNIELSTASNILLLYQSANSASVRVGIGFTDPLEALHVNGNIRGNLTAGALRINTLYGYLDLGPQNTVSAQISTDRSNFLFNKPLSSTGNFNLQTDGNTRISVLSNNGNVGIGVFSPSEILEINGNIRGNISGGALRINTINGYLDLGPQSAASASISTDRNYFSFNKPISSIGDFIFQTDGVPRARFNADGRIGLRTNSPVLGKFQFGSDYPIYFDDNIYSAGTEWKTSMIGFNLVKKSDGMWYTKYDGAYNGGCAITTDAQGQFYFYSFPSNGNVDKLYADAAFVQHKVFTIGNQGDVYIPNCLRIGQIANSEQYSLSVDGKIIAEEVVVKMSGNWPDYVFSENYSLKSLAEIEDYIKANKHLPGMPSSSEIEKNGIPLGTLNETLVKKIEELTLYIIQQEKRIKSLEAVLKSDNK